MRWNLPAGQMPEAWFNVVPQLPEPLQPDLHPGTREPVGPDDLAPLFPMALIGQEVTAEPWVDIPGEVIDVLRLWRPTPLVRAGAAGTSPRHPGSHLLQGRVGVARRVPQTEHRGPAGLLQQAGRHRAARNRDRSGPVGKCACLRLCLVRAGVQGVHGARVLQPEALPAGDDGGLGRIGRAVTGRRPRQPRISRHGDQRRST